jgi:tetratricopeptide (TPR) repeat protein
VNDLLAGLLSALVSTNTPLAVSNLVHQKTGLAIEVTDPNDPAEQAYRKLIVEDDEALAEITRWREEGGKESVKLSAVEISLLHNRIRQRAAPVRKSYEAFLEKYPRHTNARIAFAAFLDELGESEEAGRQLEQAVQINPSSPAALNNLANYFGHTGKLTNAFALYETAIRLSPQEPLYCENLATIVFTFRRDAMAYYSINEPEVFTKALGLYRKALELDPKNFDRAVELAKTYYGVKAPPNEDPEEERQAKAKLAEEALAAWRVAYELARDEAEKEGVRLHFARWQINTGRFEDARKNLDAVTNETFVASKNILLKKLNSRQAQEQKSSQP